MVGAFQLKFANFQGYGRSSQGAYNASFGWEPVTDTRAQNWIYIVTGILFLLPGFPPLSCLAIVLPVTERANASSLAQKCREDCAARGWHFDASPLHMERLLAP